MKFGAIDIGTNAARLLIGEISTNKEGYTFVRKVAYTRIPLRLGMEVFETGVISEKKMIEFSKTMHAFKLMAEVYGVKKIRACATSAMREATNGKEVQAYIKKNTNLTIEIIEGDEEARLIFSSFFLLDFEKNNAFIVIDVGGGSTEISIFENGEKIASKSFKLGTIRYLKNKLKDNIWDKIENWLKENTKPEIEYRTFGTGGNINKAHKILNKKAMESISFVEMKELYEKIKKMPIKTRIQSYDFKLDRADVIVPALHIYTFCMERIKAQQIFVPKIGLADGMVYDLYLKSKEKTPVKFIK